MPELPEVETVRAGLEPALKGSVIGRVELRRGDLRIPFPKNLTKTLAGRKIRAIERRAKYLLFFFDSEDVMLTHLGMTGRFSVTDGKTKPQAHDHMILHLKDGRQLIYNDARRFGLVTLTTKSDMNKHPLLAHLGPEPLDKTFSSTYLKSALAKRKGPIKPVLMDQELVVGVGNIYASEALFLAGIDPRLSASKAAPKARELVAAIRKVLRDAIASGGSSLRDFVHVSGETGYFQHRFNVYGRAGKPCFSCGSEVSHLRQAGRATFFCTGCQKPQ